MNIVSWNCRGLGSKYRSESVMDLIKTKKPIVLLLQETKLEVNEALSKCKKLWKQSEGQEVSARGASGGLCTLWNNSIFHLITNQ
jgi:exonuclease III